VLRHWIVIATGVLHQRRRGRRHGLAAGAVGRHLQHRGVRSAGATARPTTRRRSSVRIDAREREGRPWSWCRWGNGFAGALW